MRGEHQGYRQPALRPPGLMAVMSKDNLLTYSSVHLSSKCLVRHNQIDAPLIPQGRTRDGLFVEGRNHRTPDSFRDGRFGVSDPERQRIQGLLHTVRPHLIGITNAWPHMGM